MRSRLVACGSLALVVASLLFGGVAPAGAQEPDETVEVLRGNLKDTKDTRERDDDEPVEGVSIFVRSAAGEDIDSAESDADGRWEIGVPDPGHYEEETRSEAPTPELTLTKRISIADT